MVLPVDGGVIVVLGRGVGVTVAVSVWVALVEMVDIVWVVETIRVAVGGTLNVLVGLYAGPVLVAFCPAGVGEAVGGFV